ncbi:sulfatase-like hydrolase/transferase [Ruthenibacterium sp. CLA-JM-H11]|uniref:Sulfatase-like hydrolase/transferase n=1 Tax=Ruthenibacterium intestinale TaxID=3133163 RepID=A0ABV1GDQ1_9FIRM
MNHDKERPNVLFVLTDDQGYWALGSSGNRDIQTPNLDRLAREGARFENFFCASPVCSPARASLLTGRIPSQHGVHDWIRGGNCGSGSIEYLRGMRGYTEDLADAGYQCALSGKWHLGAAQVPQKGFTRWYVHQRGGGPYYNAPMIRDGKPVEEPGYITDVITDKALEFLEEMVGQDAPFYLGVHYTAPHSPWSRANHPAELFALYEDCTFADCPVREPHPWAIFSDAPDAPTRENARHPAETLKGYYAAVTGVDRNVGRLLQRMEQLGVLDNTLVIFTSDNGFNCGHHGIWGKGNGTFPLNMYDTSVKVPLIWWHPGRIPAGKVVQNMVSAYDFMPTLLEYLHLNAPQRPQLPGQSFAGLLQGESYPVDKGAPVVVFDEYGAARMIRTYVDKLIVRYPYGPDEYYDLEQDPGEEENRIDDRRCALRIQQLRRRMERWFARYADPAMDGRMERVSGNGQLDRAGLKAEGRPNYAPLGHEARWKV